MVVFFHCKMLICLHSSFVETYWFDICSLQRYLQMSDEEKACHPHYTSCVFWPCSVQAAWLLVLKKSFPDLISSSTLPLFGFLCFVPSPNRVSHNPQVRVAEDIGSDSSPPKKPFPNSPMICYLLGAKKTLRQATCPGGERS